MGAVIVFYDQFAVIVFAGLGKKQRYGQIGADARSGQRIAAHRIVNMDSEMLPYAVTIEQRRKDV